MTRGAAARWQTLVAVLGLAAVGCTGAKPKEPDVEPEPGVKAETLTLASLDRAEIGLSAELTMLDEMPPGAGIALLAIDDLVPGVDAEVPYLADLNARGVFQKRGIRARVNRARRGVNRGGMPGWVELIARDRALLEAIFADAALPKLPETHQMRYGRVVAKLTPDSEPELLWTAFVTATGAIAVGTDVVAAEPFRLMRGDAFDVEVTFNETAAKRFAEHTRAHINRRVAMMLGDIVFSAPVVAEPISSGRVLLTFGQTPHSDVLANVLADRLDPR